MNIDKLALEKLTAEFDRFIGECWQNGIVITPNIQAVMRARGCMPSNLKNGFKKKGKS